MFIQVSFSYIFIFATSYSLVNLARNNKLVADPIIKSQALDKLANKQPRNFILVDIRPGYPGGDFPIFGSIKLRSLYAIMDFLADGIENSPEFDVEPDPRTGEISENPKNTLSILVDKPSPSEFLRVPYRGHEYTIGYTSWDYDTFKNLYHLFQTAVTDVSTQVVPITISK